VRSNYTVLTVGCQDVDSQPGAAVEPAAAPAGTALTFRARNDFMSERIFTWINLSGGGVRESKLNGVAGEDGSAELRLGAKKLAPGQYSLVIFGESSKSRAFVPFTVQ
jgi:hypothetical protein